MDFDFLNFANIKHALNFDPALLHDAVDELWTFLSKAKPDKKAFLEELPFQNIPSNGSIDDAIQNLTNLLEKDKGSKDIHKYMALSFIVKENFEMALHYLNEALWMDPKDADLYMQKGNILFRNNDIVDAYTCFEKACLLDSNLQDAQDMRSKLYKKLGLDMNQTGYEYLLGTVHYELGYLDEAVRHYHRAIELDHKNNDAIYNLKVVSDLIERTSTKTPIPIQSLPIVSVYEYATLSEAIYAKSNAVVPDGWELLTTSEQQRDENGNFSRDGFRAMARVHHEKKHIIIVIQGSETGDDLISNVHLVFNRMDRQWICAKKFTERVLDMVHQDPVLKEYDISATGHSLGGAQAEFMSYLFGFKSVTFESPGALELIRSYDEGVEVDPKKVNNISFLARPNIINTAKTHTGRIVRLYPPLPSCAFRVETTAQFLRRVEFLNKVSSAVTQYGLQLVEDAFGKEILRLFSLSEQLINETGHWHSMIQICRLLKYENELGIPLKMRNVVSWPTVDRYYMYWRTSKEIEGHEPDEFVVGELNQEALRASGYIITPESIVLNTNEFTKDELLFLCEYKQSPKEYEDHITPLEKTVLDSIDITSSTVTTGVGISPIHFVSFVSTKTKTLKEITQRLSVYYKAM